MLSVEELLQPRIKCLHDDWQGVFNKDEIFLATRMQDKSWRFYFEDDYVYLEQDEIKKYPHLFHEMFWWEERKVEDMPGYVKVAVGGGIGRVIKIKEVTAWPDVYMFHLSNVIPATKEEYEQYQTLNNK